MDTDDLNEGIFIDSHAHIYATEFDPDRAGVIERAVQAGVGKIVMPNVDHATIDAMLDAESRYAGTCIATMGLHPCSVKNDFEKELYIVEDWLSKREFAAVGEMGTDLYWDKAFWDQQCEAFAIQARWAKQYKLPLIIHCRESLDETITLVENLQDGDLSGVFHCFTGTAEQAEKIIKLNFMVGIGGVSTFKKGGLDTVLPAIGLEDILLETDSPYLSPVPHRGKRNEPSYIPLIAQRIAEIKQVPLTEVMTTTTTNARRLFHQNN